MFLRKFIFNKYSNLENIKHSIKLDALGDNPKNSGVSKINQLSDSYLTSLEMKLSNFIPKNKLNKSDLVKKILLENPPISQYEWKNFLFTKLKSRIQNERDDILMPEFTPLHPGIQEELEKGIHRELKPLPPEFSTGLIDDFSKILEFLSHGLLVQQYYKEIDVLFEFNLSENPHLNSELEGRLLVFKSLATDLFSIHGLNQINLPGVPSEKSTVMLTIHGGLDEQKYKEVSCGNFGSHAEFDLFLSRALKNIVNIAFDPIAQSNSATNNDVIHGSLPHLISFMAICLAIQDNSLKLNNTLDTIVRCSLEVEWLADVKSIHQAGSTVSGSIGSVWAHWDATGGLDTNRVSRWYKGISLTCADDITSEISNSKKYPSLGFLQRELASYLVSDKVRQNTCRGLRPLIPGTVSYEFIPPLKLLKKMNIFEIQKWQKGLHLYKSIELNSKNKTHRILFLSENTPKGKEGFERLSKYYENVIPVFWSPEDGLIKKNEALKKIKYSTWDRLIAWKADLVIPPSILKKGSCENFHPAPLNAPGLGFKERAFITPEKFCRETWGNYSYYFGGTYHFMIKEIDAGRVLSETLFKYSPDWDYSKLQSLSDEYMFFMLEDLAWHTSHFKMPDQSEILTRNSNTLNWCGKKMIQSEIEPFIRSAPKKIKAQLGYNNLDDKISLPEKCSFLFFNMANIKNKHEAGDEAKKLVMAYQK